MKIKLLTASILAGFANALPAGAVVESDEAFKTDEFKALIAVGYAKETKEAVTHKEDGFEPVKPIIAVDDDDDDDGNDTFEAQEGDTDLLAVLEGNTKEVTEFLDELDAPALARLAVLESRGQDRKGVMAAITAAQEQE